MRTTPAPPVRPCLICGELVKANAVCFFDHFLQFHPGATWNGSRWIPGKHDRTQEKK